MDNNTPTGLKQLLQSMYPEGPTVIEGIVTGVEPVQITLANDSIMVLSGTSIVVPEHLTDYSVRVEDKVITIYSALKKNDIVFLLPVNNGKRYYVLGRKG